MALIFLKNTMYMCTIPLPKLYNLEKRKIHITHHRTLNGIYACILLRSCCLPIGFFFLKVPKKLACPGMSPAPHPLTVLPQKCWFCSFHAVFVHFIQIILPQVDPIWETLLLVDILDETHWSNEHSVAHHIVA